MPDKSDRAPWYVIAFRLFVVLCVVALMAAMVFCIPFWADKAVIALGIAVEPFYTILLLSHPWLVIVWIIVSVVIAVWTFVDSFTNTILSAVIRTSSCSRRQDP